MSFDSFDISASGLYAQRTKMDVISSNIANINTTRSPDGKANPYIRKQAVFSAIYNNAIGDNNFSQGGISQEFDKNSGNLTLKGSISNDSGISNGVSVSQVANDKNPFKSVYDPSHPDADAKGFVQMPNINIVTEMVDMMTASKAYEANVSSIEAAKTMISSAMKI